MFMDKPLCENKTVLIYLYYTMAQIKKQQKNKDALRYAERPVRQTGISSEAEAVLAAFWIAASTFSALASIKISSM